MLSQVSKRAFSVRAFSTSRVSLTAPPPSGNNSFNDREKAQEGAYIKKHEAEQLAKLREELAKQKESLNKLEDQIKDIKN
ncbi:ATPase inhibitor, mitochondrial [[Candida] anglica]|uniref:ATPase inhibitor, mitochondrial n=1 Tax=[Candida] anglica TaxID=148631 RepID=A0ABP0EI46_9ASCO